MEIEVKEGYPIVPFSLIRTGEVFGYARDYYIKIYPLSIPTGACNAIQLGNDTWNADISDNTMVERVKARLVIEPYGNCS